MPWKEYTMEQSRLDFVTEALENKISFSELCRNYSITRKTGYKWMERFNNGESLKDLSRKPFHTPNKTPADVEQVIINARLKHPEWGPRKLRKWLENNGYDNLPSTSTFAAILKRNGFITPQASAAHTPYKRFERSSPNQLWQTDFKGDFLLQNQTRCFPLTITDDCSRYSLNIKALDNTRLPDVKASFVWLFKTYGLPDAILCDNGNPWGVSQGSGYTRFDIMLMQLDIQPMHGRPLHPQTQGKEERFHRTMKQELLKYYIPFDLNDAQKCFDKWRYEYNHERPHEALELKAPADVYVCSEREMPDRIRDYEYPDSRGIRKVKSTGYFSYNSHTYFLSEAFANETIYVYPAEKDGFVNIRYRNFKIGKINLRELMFCSKKIYPL